MNRKNFRSLELVARKLIKTYFAGGHATNYKDSLIEIDVVREYQPGDRKLDSKSSLKIGRTMSRVFNPERSMNVFIILDMSASSFSTLDASVITALYLCYLADLCNEKVGICIFSDKILTVVNPTEDCLSVQETIRKAYESFETSSGTAMDQALRATSNLFLNNCLFFLISDFYCDINTKIIKQMASMDANNFISIIMTDKRDWIDIDIPFNISFMDSENNGSVNFDGKSKPDYDTWTSGIKTNLQKSNSDVVIISAEEERFLLPLIKCLMRT